MKKQQESIARVGRSGYRGHKEQWEKEKNDPEKHTVYHDISDPAARNYVLGRMKPNKEGKRSLCADSSLIDNIVIYFKLYYYPIFHNCSTTDCVCCFVQGKDG